MSAGLVAVSHLRLPPAAHAETTAALYVLSPTEARIFAAVADRITFTGDAAMPRFGDTAGLHTVDTALRQLDADTAGQFRGALVLFQYAPPFAGVALATFTNLKEEDQDDYLRLWEHSRFEIPRLAFHAFKNLAMLGYYADDSTWKGIHYGGPWAPRPRRVLSDER
jgi:hypothetical protein